jgi:hypothetical protein
MGPPDRPVRVAGAQGARQRAAEMAEDQDHGGRQAASTGRSTRRRLLAGVAGVLGVAAAEVVGTSAPAQANNKNPVLQGFDNGYPTRRTAVFTPNNTEVGILADPNTSGKGSLGVYGIGQDTGVLGEGHGSAAGVRGTSVSGIGVVGVSGASGGTIGVYGAGDVGVAAYGNSIGVYGQSGTTGLANTLDGVCGVTDNGSAAGVRGWHFSGGIGVTGTTTSTGSGGSAAVDGTNNGTGPGVRGAGGIGVLAQATGSGATALSVHGPAVFSRSGVVTVAAGHSSATKAGVALTAASLILATLQQHTTGVYVTAAVPDVAGSSFTVYLSQTVTAATKVAWFIVN